MTQRELFQAATAHRVTEEFLYYANFTADLGHRMLERNRLKKGEDLAAFYGFFSPASVEPAIPQGPKPDFTRYFADVARPDGSFINPLGVLEIPARLYHLMGYVSPLRNAQTLRDLEEFPYPVSANLDESGMKHRVEQAREAGRVTRTPLTHMYEDAWQIRGYEQFLADMVQRPEWCEYILDRIAERNLNRATAAARAGVDYLFSGDDVANQRALMFSLPMWRDFMKKRWARVYAAARSIKPDIQIWYHSDGNIWDIIPELIEIGVTILNPVQPECLNVLEVKKRFGKNIVMDGTIGTQTTMPFGTPEEVRQVVRDRKKTLGSDGALILSPTHVLEPEVPVENVEAFVEACREKP